MSGLQTTNIGFENPAAVPSARESGSSSTSSPGFSWWRTRFLHLATVFVLLLAVTIMLQIRGNAYGAELGAFPDESAHFVTGLMIRDYIASGFQVPPVEFAENYYMHYPKVAFGMFGPLLHVLEGLWLLVFPVSRASILVLMASISALTATLLYSVLAREFNRILGLAGAVVFLLVPTVQAYTGMVMADGLVALCDVAAAIAFARYLESRGTAPAIWFAVFTCLSVLSKGNGVALVLLPPVALLVTRQWSLLKDKGIAIAALVIAAVAGPWQLYSARMLSGILDRQPPFAFLGFYATWIFTIAGPVLLPFIVLGVYHRVLSPGRTKTVRPIWACAFALLASVFVFHVLIPAAAPEARYLIAVVPSLLLFAVEGIHRVLVRLPFSLSPATEGRRTALVALVLVTACVSAGFDIPHKIHHGHDQVAAFLQQPLFRDSAILVSSEADGEGMLIAETAMRESRPGHYVLRATKMLSRSDWNSNHYALLYPVPEAVRAFLAGVPVHIVVFDHSKGAGTFPHHALLLETIRTGPSDWSLLAAFPPNEPQSRQVEVYEFKPARPRSQTRHKFEIKLPYTLGRTLTSADTPQEPSR